MIKVDFPFSKPHKEKKEKNKNKKQKTKNKNKNKNLKNVIVKQLRHFSW